MKLTREELEAVDRIFENPSAEIIYGGNIHAYVKEVEAIKDMSEEELRAKYPGAYYWIDRWKQEASG